VAEIGDVNALRDREVLKEKGLVKTKNPDRQAERILGLIEHALSTDIDVLLFPELVGPFSHLKTFEEALKETDRDLVANICYEHTHVRDLASILAEQEIERHGLDPTEQKTKLVNFCRVLVKAGSEVEVFTQIKLTPFSTEFSLASKDTLFCGKVLYRFRTNWGNFLFLICKDYVGEVRTDRRTPMFDFLKTLTDEGLHYVFVSALNSEPEAFTHAARAFYYLQEKSNHTFTLFLNTAELNSTMIVFPGRPHPKVRPGKDTEILPLFQGKPGWGTQVKFPGCGEKTIAATFLRLDRYQPMATKEIFSPLYQTELHDLSELGIEWEAVDAAETAVAEEAISAAGTHNFPLLSTPFVGREGELSEIRRLLEKPSCRLLTLVGPGGIGKTRLALEAAAEIAQFSNGVYFVPLAALDSPAFLVTTVANFLGSPFHGREDPKLQLLNYLREKKVLLVMDNFEHLLEGAGLLTEILDSASGVKILATSRERLRLKGEQILDVQGMDFPRDEVIDGAENYSAVQLFAQNAQRVRPGFTLSEEKYHVVRICQLVEGMPLGVELASGWLKVLSCEDVVREIENGIDFLSTSMRDIPERHRSIRAVFEHSWNLLSEREREVCMKMSVFRGGFRREAATEVAGATLSHLLSLVDKSLVRWNPSERYEMHELLRKCMEEKLSESVEGRERVHDFHSEYYAEFLLQRKERLRGRQQREVLGEIGEEIENIREGWNWAIEKEKKDVLENCCESLFRFYVIRGLFQEGEETFARAAERLGAAGNESGTENEGVLGKILARHGVLLGILSEYERATDLLERSLKICKVLDDRQEVGFCLRNLGLIAFRLGERQEAEDLLREGLVASKEINDRDGIATSLNSLGHASYERGEYEEAKKLYSENLAIRRETGDQQGAAKALMNLGNIAHRLGEGSDAENLYQQSLSISTEIGDRVGMASCLNNLGLVADALGKYEEAQKLYRRSLALKKEIGDRRGMATSLGNLGNVASRLGQYAEAKRLHEECLSICRHTGDRGVIAGALHGLGHAACALGEYEDSKRYLYEGLQIAWEIKAIPVVLAVLVGLAALLVKQDESDSALDFLLLALHHPSAWRDTKDEAERVYLECTSRLPAEVIAAADKRTRQVRLEKLVEEILTEK